MSTSVSVIIPCYQDAQFLEQTITSVIRQSWSELEVVISDEGVDPECEEIATSFDDTRIHYFKNQQRLGMTKNWNAALDRTRGDYVIKLDGDDLMAEKTVEFLLRALKQNPDAGFAACTTFECDTKIKDCSLYGIRGFNLAGIAPEIDQLLTPEQVFPYLFDDNQLWHSCSMMFPRTNIVTIGKWDERWGCASDTEIILRAFLNGFSLAHCGYQGIYYRKREHSVSYDFRLDARLLWESTLIHLNAINSWVQQKKPLSRPLRIAWYRYWLRLKNLRLQNNSSEYEYYSQLAEGIAPPPAILRILENTRMMLHATVGQYQR
jgi:glycosyltransferase involved in cell wall biosynthesis